MLDIVQFNLCVVECVHEKVLAGLPKHCLFHEDATAGLVGIVHFDAVGGIAANGKG